MLEISRHQAIYLAVKPVDMRKSFDGLSAIIYDVLKLNPLAGQLFVFRNKSGDKIKLLMWDRNGFVQYYKRLEKGRFKWPERTGEKYSITARELELLMDGVDLKRIKRLPSIELTGVV